jgi:hypothetical protein
VRQRERLMLALRLDEPLALRGVGRVLDERALDRLVGLDLVERGGDVAGGTLRLTERGRFLGDAVTVELVA